MQAHRSLIYLTGFLFLVLGRQQFWPTHYIDKAELHFKTTAFKAGQVSELALTGKLSLKLTDTETLACLPHIGPKTAQSIIQWRDQHPDQLTPQTLTSIPGIGPQTQERVKFYLH